ncbi:MAG: hypothetical protein NT178_14315 [Proteobacteria bacterium]|nr:hypothetical protein [Pseudomonadota bacterium]
MKILIQITVGMVVLFMVVCTAMAIDIDTLDRVSVLMSKSKVHSLLGTPDEIDELKGDLKVEVYRVNNMDPMVGAGCIYEKDQQLVGQSFVFQGEMGKEAADRLKKNGFIITEEKEGTFRLLGKDDDTGNPLMVHIILNNGLTVIMTFEKDFYDRRIKE